MSLLEMKFNNGVKSLEIKMDGIEPDVVAKIIDSCMAAVNDKKDKKVEEKPKQEAPVKSAVDYKAGYQLFKEPVLESKDEPLINSEPKKTITAKINTYNDRSIRLKNGVKFYQTFYICPDCGNKGKHFIQPGTPKIHCQEASCSHQMMVRLATPRGLPDQDEFGNYYIAGDFKMSMKDKEDEEAYNNIKEAAAEETNKVLQIN